MKKVRLFLSLVIILLFSIQNMYSEETEKSVFIQHELLKKKLVGIKAKHVADVCKSQARSL